MKVAIAGVEGKTGSMQPGTMFMHNDKYYIVSSHAGSICNSTNLETGIGEVFADGIDVVIVPARIVIVMTNV